MVLVRLLDQEEMGAYFIALFLVSLMVVFSDFGGNLALVKCYPECDAYERPSLIRAALMIRCTSSGVVALALFLLAAYSGTAMMRSIAPFISPLLVLFFLHAVRGLLLSILQAEMRFRDYAATQVLAASLKVLLALGLLFLDDVNVGHVLIVENIAIFTSVLFAVWRGRRHLKALIRSRTRGTYRLLSFGLPLYLNALVNLGNDRVSDYMVAVLGGPIAMAKFSVAGQLANAGRRMFVSFTNVYLPIQTRHFAGENGHAARQLASRSMLWVAFIVGLGALVFAAFRAEIMTLFFTIKYIDVADMAVFFIVAHLFRALQVLLGYYSVAAGYNYFPIRVSLVSSVFNIALTWMLFHRLGYEGAVIALMLTQILIGLLYYIWLRRAKLDPSVWPVVLVLLFFIAGLTWIMLVANFLLNSIAVLVFPAACILCVPSLKNDLVMILNWVREWREARLGLRHQKDHQNIGC